MTMMDVLRDEISKPEYVGLTDQQVADAVNAKTVTVRRPVPTWLVRQAAIEAGYWAALADAAASPVDAVRRLAVNVLAWIDDQSGTVQTVDMDRPSVVAMRAALVAAGICTQAQVDGLDALANAAIPWTESVGLPAVGIGLIVNARRT
jgi:hypothetical protein